MTCWRNDPGHQHGIDLFNRNILVSSPETSTVWYHTIMKLSFLWQLTGHFLKVANSVLISLTFCLEFVYEIWFLTICFWVGTPGSLCTQTCDHNILSEKSTNCFTPMKNRSSQGALLFSFQEGCLDITFVIKWPGRDFQSLYLVSFVFSPLTLCLW